MIVFGPFCIAHFLVVAGKCVVRNDHNFCRLIGSVVVAEPAVLDELNVAYNTKGATPIVLYLRHAHFPEYGQALACPEELLKRRRRTEVSVFLQLAAMVPIGRHAFN
jgi:hypothetical protein